MKYIQQQQPNQCRSLSKQINSHKSRCENSKIHIQIAQPTKNAHFWHKNIRYITLKNSSKGAQYNKNLGQNISCTYKTCQKVRCSQATTLVTTRGLTPAPISLDKITKCSNKYFTFKSDLNQGHRPTGLLKYPNMCTL